MRKARLAMPLLLVLAFGATGRAASPDTGTLARLGQVVSWHGATSGGPGYAPPVHTPQTCALASRATLCDAFDLTVAVADPGRTFTKPNDGLFVTVRWATDFDQWNLFVYAPDGSLAAQGDTLDSNAQAVLIPHPANGTYKVVVVPFYMDASMGYTGQARFLLDGAARMRGSTVLAPRLSTVAPHDFHLACDQPDPTTMRSGSDSMSRPPNPA